MSRLTDLLRRVEQLNPDLAKELTGEFKTLAERRAFGLNFERHVPETFELPNRKVRRGDKVRFLPERGHADKTVNHRVWLVERIEGRGDQRTAHLVELHATDQPATAQRRTEDLVVVAEFRDPIYPGLVSTGKVERGGDKPFHAVINSENFHALKALLFAYEGKVDCIYIDPPYNTRDKDWKYNNDYVDADDTYKHSKWLAMMERRLVLAKQLLNPDDSVLIVTIDEKEYLRLGLLVEQMFSGARMQMVSIAINGAVVSRARSFGRTDEFVYFVYLGDGGPEAMTLPSEWISAKGVTHRGEIRWDRLIRSGTGTSREDSPGGFYPIYVDPAGPSVHSVGQPLGLGESDPAGIEGCVPVLPIRSNKTEGRWQISRPEFLSRLSQGRIRVGGNARRGFTVYYLKDGEYQKVVDGLYAVTSYRPDSSIVTDTIEENVTV